MSEDPASSAELTYFAAVGDQEASSPSRVASIAACRRPSTPSLVRIRPTCVVTVRRLIVNARGDLPIGVALHQVPEHLELAGGEAQTLRGG